LKKILSIAGSDCSGGAGIQADLKTITAHKMYGMTVITALTAQNTTGVYGIMDATPECVAKQLDCIFTDIIPDAVKIGMVSNSEIIAVISKKLIEYKARNIVIDPVMISTSGSKLLSETAETVLIRDILPLASIVTPNIPEAEFLSGITISDERDMQKAASLIYEKIGVPILIKGGHLVNDATDLLFENGICYWYRAVRVNTKNTHGTGCTLSSAIACNLADGNTINESIQNAKNYLTGALNFGLDLGLGNGPINHMYAL